MKILNELDAKLEEIETYDGLFFTSPKAAEVFLDRFTAKDLKFSGKIYVLGSRAKMLFEKFDFEIVYRAEANTAEALINSFNKSEFVNKKFLFVRGDKSLRTIPELLKNIAEIDEMIVYQTIANTIAKQLFKEIKAKFQHQTINCICFFSPLSVESFVNLFAKELLNDAKIAAIGTTTAKKIVEENLQIDFVAAKTNAKDFAFELIEYLRKL